MKNWKIVGIIVVVLVVIILSFAVSNKGGSATPSSSTTLSNDAETIITNAQNESDAVKESEMKEPKQIDVYEYLDYKDGSVAKIVLLARPTCHYCQIAEPIINNIAYEYNIEINYLNTDNFNEEAQTLFVKSDDAFSEGFGTPYLMIVKDGKIVDSIEGLTDRAHYVEFFKGNGFIG